MNKVVMIIQSKNPIYEYTVRNWEKEIGISIQKPYGAVKIFGLYWIDINVEVWWIEYEFHTINK